MYCNLGMQECKKWWDTGYKRICALDTKYSEWLGVPESIKKTSVKPGGTVPLLAGVEGGMKASESEYQFRTIRVDVKSPLVQAHIDAGYRVEQDVYTPRSSVIYFPIHDTRSKRFASDFTVWEQAEICAALQAYWADNQVSCTITFKKDEAKDIPRLLELFEGRLKSMSFLPLSEHGYVQAPYIACSREEYETAVSKIQPIDWTKISINNEALEKYCEGQVCERGA
jgi:hypothetical protein